MKIKNLYGMVPRNMGFSIENTCVHSFLSHNLFRAILFTHTSIIEQESKVNYTGLWTYFNQVIFVMTLLI